MFKNASMSLLAPIDIPTDLAKLYQESKNLSKNIVATFRAKGEVQYLQDGASLFEEDRGFAFIEEGIFRLYKKDKLLRFYSEGDLILISDLKNLEGFSFRSELSSKIRVLKKDQVFTLLSDDPSLLKEFYLWLEVDQTIHQYLCSLYIQEGNHPQIEVSTYQPHEEILSEGEESQHVCILLEGQAEVFQKGKKIAEIKREEIFGELSFFTQGLRTATVKAKTVCMVQEIAQDDFVKVLPQRPVLMEALLRSMAERIVLLNEKKSSH